MLTCMQMQRKQITVSGQQVSYLERGGSGIPFLFLHGWGGSAESFLPLIEGLDSDGVGTQNRLIVLDFPGFGESEDPHETWDVPRYTQCVVDFLSQLGIEKVHIVSHSFGGRVTTLLLAQHAPLVQKAFYIAPAGIRHEKTGIALASQWLKKPFELPVLRSLFPLVRTVGYKLIGGHDYLNVSGVMKETFKRVVEHDISDQFSRIDSPVFVVIGRNDTYVPYTDGEVMREAISGAQLQIIEDGRHGIHKTHVPALIPFFKEFFGL